MYKHKYLSHRSLLTLCILTALLMIGTVSASASCREIVYDEVYHFQVEDFSAADNSAAPRGVLLTEVPQAEIGHVYLGSRRLQPGDALNSDTFARVRFEPTCEGDVTAELCWIPVFADSASTEASLLIEIGNGKNIAPTAENGTLETYRNIPIDGKIRFSDPDDEELNFALSKEPKRGKVSINSDGSYIYTPEKNKVGKDSFTVLITDSAGNAAEAEIKVTIIKPTDKTTFADLEGDPDQYVAMWLREEGVYAGQTMSGTLLFQPDQPVSRGEFLVMAMNLLNIKPTDQILSTGFADETDTPAWMRPYLVTALRNGFISGVNSPEGLCFRHDAAITQAEAAVMLQHMLGLEKSDALTVFSTDDIPAWAMDAVSCLCEYGIVGLDTSSNVLTMRETANLLHQVYKLWSSDQLSSSLLAWAADA